MLWIVGKVFADFKYYLDSNGIEYGIFTDINSIANKLYSVPTWPLDFSSKQTVISSLGAMTARYDVSAIITAGYEQYVVPSAWLSEHFKVPGLTPDAAIAATDKSVMRRKFKDYNPEITPEFAEITDWSNVITFMDNHAFPVMLKPTNLMKSLFVTQNNTWKDLAANFKQMKSDLPAIKQRLRMHEQPAIIIEECMIGSMHTVAGFVDAAGKATLLQQIVDCATAQDIGRDDNYIFKRQLASNLKQPQEQSILDTARQGIEALKLASAPLHIEIMLTQYGPKIIEIGARLGGYRPRMYEYAYGINLHQATVEMAFDRPVIISAKLNKHCAVLELFPVRPGGFKRITNLNLIERLGSIKSLAVKAKEGKAVGPAKLGYRAASIITLASADRVTLEKDIVYISSHVDIELN